MSARADRRADKRLVLSKGSESDIGALAAALRRSEKLEEFVRAYKARLERMVMGLNMIQKAVIKNDIPAVSQLIRALFATDLKESREVVANREQALDIATEALRKCLERKWVEITDGSGPEDSTPKEKGMIMYVGSTHIEAKDALEKIALLAPETAPTGLPS